MEGMGLFTFLKSLFNKDDEDLEDQVRELEEEGSKTDANVSTGPNSAVTTQKTLEQQENLQTINEREILWEMNKKIDELLEIKELYEDMLDWMVEISKKDNEKSREESRSVSTKGREVSKLSPRLRQVVEIVKEKGELDSSDLSEEIDLSRNRCSELLNTLFKANYLSKERAGRKVYYRVNPDKEDVLEI